MTVLEYFGLNEQPFRIGPDPRYLFYSAQVKEAIAKCEYMARDRVAPIYMYGPIGSGKTSILRRLNERLSTNNRYNVAYVIAPNVRRANTFLKVAMDAFDIESVRAYDANLKIFESYLIEQYKKKITPVLLLDEAQNANRDALRLIHYLLNFETATTKLLQIVLAGQEELAGKILRYKELASRMFPIAINAMSSKDLEEMIRFRWMVAGGKGMPFVDGDAAYKALYARSKGLPRDAVKVCDEILRMLLVDGRKQATAADVQQIAQELNLVT
jgi:general secretion pathway protein A